VTNAGFLGALGLVLGCDVGSEGYQVESLSRSRGLVQEQHVGSAAIRRLAEDVLSFDVNLAVDLDTITPLKVGDLIQGKRTAWIEGMESVDALSANVVPRSYRCAAFQRARPDNFTARESRFSFPGSPLRWRLPGVAHCAEDPELCGIGKLDRSAFNVEVAPDLRLTNAAGFGNRAFGGYRPALSLMRGYAGIIGGGTSSRESEQPNQQAPYAKVERPLRPQNALSRSVRSLPLGAKIGLTVILTLGATGVWCVGFVRVLERRSNVAKACGYGLFGLALFSGGFLPWW
jgi:hypothetical protein